MQINIDKKTGALLAIIAVLVAIVFGISITGKNGDHEIGMNNDKSMGLHHDSASTTVTGADVMFLQMMIPHHQQAIDISNLALKTSKDSELLTLASSIIKSQSAEIVQMKSWLNDARATDEMGHSMGMGGMLDDAELSKLSAATGRTFDKFWLEGMIGHHDGAIHMTTMIADAANTEIKVFGENVVKDQSAQIVQMKEMLKRLG